MGLSGNVLIAAPVHAVLIEGLEAMGYNCMLIEKIRQEDAYGLIGDCKGIITSTRLQLDEPLLNVAGKLEWIGRMGSGMEVIDLEYAGKRGIACFGSPEGNCNAVGEQAIGMLLSLLHRITWSNQEIIEGIWSREENRGTELEGKTVGIIGYGHTGRSFAKKLQGFDVRILAYDKYLQGETTGSIIYSVGLDRIYEEADIVSFHVPLQKDTIHLFNSDFIERMQRPFILVNTSRGVVVDTTALLDALDSGKILGACLDVFENEPITTAGNAVAERLKGKLAHPSLIVTPHIAGYTFEALYKMSRVLLEKIKAHMNG